jgi:hypothetical protein
MAELAFTREQVQIEPEILLPAVSIDDGEQ